MKRLESSVKAPDRNAQFEELYAQYADDVLRMAYFYLADKQKAEDVCQDVFIKLYTRGENIAPGREKAWLLRVTVNHCKNHLASAWFRKRADLDEGIPALDNAELEVVSAVAALPAKYRAVVHLYYFEGYSTKEIAEILHSRPNTVSSRLSRARALLAKALKEEIV